MLAEAFRQGPLGIAADIVAVNVSPWGFDPPDLRAPAFLFYGDADVLIPPEHGMYWARRLPGASLHLVPDAGHLLPLTAWAEILSVTSRA